MRRGFVRALTQSIRSYIMPAAQVEPLHFQLTPTAILQVTNDVINKAESELSAIGAMTANPTFDNALSRLAKLEATLQTETAAASFLQHVSSDKAVRDASVEAQMLLDAFYIEKGMREDVYLIAKAVHDAEAGKLQGESARFLEKVMLGFKQNGLALSAADRDVLKAKRKCLADLCTGYSRNLNEDNTSVLMTTEELKGCPEDFLESLERSSDGQHYVVTTKYPDVTGVMQYAECESSRRAIDVAFNSRAKANGDLLKEAITLRRECAALLGYGSHADFQLEERLAKSCSAVLRFEEDLKARLMPLGERELNRMRDLKKAETGSDSFRTWDMAYYARIIKERDYAVDQETLKNYFSLDTVMESMLGIYEEVLSLRFHVDPAVPTWHEDVKAVRVLDGTSGTEIGLFFLDLYPRDGKYSHAACFPLAPGYARSDGTRQLPISAIVANFTKPTSDKPSLLKHDEVVTMFHELGHAMHDMCALVTYSRFHGTSVETDFVEAPSQMLENWCWDRVTLKCLSKHYKTGEALSDGLIENLVRSKNFNDGLANLRQVFFGLFDLTIHSIGKSGLDNGESIDALYARLRKEITLIEQPEGICPASSFGHMMGGYDAGYYGYLWSEVFSADMFFSRFNKAGLDNGLQNGEVGQAYRREILQPGGSRDGMESIKAFLGREPTPDAFLRSIGL